MSTLSLTLLALVVVVDILACVFGVAAIYKTATARHPLDGGAPYWRQASRYAWLAVVLFAFFLAVTISMFAYSYTHRLTLAGTIFAAIGLFGFIAFAGTFASAETEAERKQEVAAADRKRRQAERRRGESY